MAAGGRGFRVNLDETELDELLHSEHGDVARWLQTHIAEPVTQEAKRLAPVSKAGSYGRPSGYMRSHIGWEIHRDERGLYTDIGCDARTPEGHLYPLDVELGSRPHIIRSHGNYPLRNRRTGQVFGRQVNHPGTRPQPFLRPALHIIPAVV